MTPKPTRPVFTAIGVVLAVIALLVAGHVRHLVRQLEVQRSIQTAAAEVSYPTGNKGRHFVVVTAATHSYLDFVRNLACSLSPKKMILLALDVRLTHSTLPPNVRVVQFDNLPSSPAHYFGSSAFPSLSRRKLSASLAVLQAGYDVLFSDADVTWCDPNAIHDIANASLNADMLVQRAAIRGQSINTGLYYARAGSVGLFNAVQLHDKNADDQQAMNAVACQRRYSGEHQRDGSFMRWCKWNNSARVEFLDKEQYPLGCTRIQNRQLRRHENGFVQALCSTRRVALVHFSCWPGAQKRKTMASRGMWFVDGDTGACTSS